MGQDHQLFNWQTISGKPITVGERTITPQSKALSITLPFGGFVWNRPFAVLVEQNRRTEQIPIVDITRQATFTLAILGIALSIIIKLIASNFIKQNTKIVFSKKEY